MALSFGWRANDQRESIWIGDPALKDVSDAAAEAWRESGDAVHLEPYATKGKPTTIFVRALTADERTFVLAPMTGNESEGEKLAGLGRAMLLAFRIGVSFKGMSDSVGRDPDTDLKRKVIVNERGIRMLATNIVDDLQKAYPGLVEFYGGLVFNASFLTDAEKKASSPPSMPTPSSAAASTTESTAQSLPPEVATGAP